MTNDNTRARFIISIGSLNNYGSTLLQTKKALEAGDTKPLRQNQDDIAIFSDALKGIAAIKKIGFTTEGIIAINQQFDTPSQEQPTWPGHLRNAIYNEDDRIRIILDQQSQTFYQPKDIITKADLDLIVTGFLDSDQTEADAWQVFVRLSKLQPFQDGNKRTALIAANAAMGALDTEDYLVLPFNDLDRGQFTIELMRYYAATTTEEEQVVFARMMQLLPSPQERRRQLRRPITDDGDGGGKTIRLKPQFR